MHKESLAPKNWGLWTVVLEKTLESPLDCKEIKLVNPKGNQSWIFIGRTDAEAETPILRSPMQRTDSLEKILMVGKIEGRRNRSDRVWDGWMASPPQWAWAWQNFWVWVGDGQGSLVCVLQSMGPWVSKSQTELSYWTELMKSSSPSRP